MIAPVDKADALGDDNDDVDGVGNSGRDGEDDGDGDGNDDGGVGAEVVLLREGIATTCAG